MLPRLNKEATLTRGACLNDCTSQELEAELDAVEDEERRHNELELRVGKDLDGDGDIGVAGHTDEERQLARAVELAKREIDAEKEGDQRAL